MPLLTRHFTTHPQYETSMTFIRTYKWLLPLLLFTGTLLAGRIIDTHSLGLVFIVWNLFLGILPLWFSHWLDSGGNKLKAWLLFAAWLVFFPNSMYIITDLFHLQKLHKIPEWYDLLLLFSAAITGAIIGYLSLFNVERFLYRQLKKPLVEVILISIFLLCGYGIYLGRYLRWNSWDILSDPFSLLDDVKEDVFHPFHNRGCWLLTLLFGVWMYLVYRYFKRLNLRQLASFL